MLKKIHKKMIIGSCLGNCVHVEGISNFLKVAEETGYETIFLGPAVPIKSIIQEIITNNPDIVAISFRLTPSVGLKLIKDFIQKIKENNLDNKTFFLGCLPKLKIIVSSLNFFHHIFVGGESTSESVQILENFKKDSPKNIKFPTDLSSLIKYKSPKPIYRTHFGLNSLEKSISEIRKIAKSHLIDVISIAPDQPAQEFFHRPKILKNCNKGAGGIPIRTIDDLKKIYNASQTGNFPLMRIYSGTQDLILNSKLHIKFLNNAWTATPIFWYSDLDGRSKRPLREAIQENLDNIAWHVFNKLPVEINDPHQWGLRAAPDHLVVADAYLCARVAKELGVRTFIQQLMFNTPSGNSLKMDLARVLAMIEIVEPLKSLNFEILKETRAGLSYFSNDLSEAKAQLALSTLYQMVVNPDIIHIVNYCEAVHAAEADHIVESAQIVNKIVEESMGNPISFELNIDIQKYKKHLLKEAKETIIEIENTAKLQNIEKPYISADFLFQLVERGIFDAPHLKKKSGSYGKIETRIIDGKCVLINPLGQPQSEKERLYILKLSNNQTKTKNKNIEEGITVKN